MKFGSTDNPGNIDFTLPPDHSENQKVLQRCDDGKPLKIYVGCAKWNKADLKGFYPRGTKDELGYYSTQFNSIELNATFYRIFSAEQFSNWEAKTPEGFKFFPKLNQELLLVWVYYLNSSKINYRYGKPRQNFSLHFEFF